MLIDASNFLRFPPHPGSIFLIDSLRSLQDPSFFFLKTERNTSSPFFLAGLIQTPSLGHSGSLSSQVARSGWSPHLVLSLSLSTPRQELTTVCVKGFTEGSPQALKIGLSWGAGEVNVFVRVWKGLKAISIQGCRSQRRETIWGLGLYSSPLVVGPAIGSPDWPPLVNGVWLFCGRGFHAFYV